MRRHSSCYVYWVATLRPPRPASGSSVSDCACWLLAHLSSGISSKQTHFFLHLGVVIKFGCGVVPFGLVYIVREKELSTTKWLFTKVWSTAKILCNKYLYRARFCLTANCSAIFFYWFFIRISYWHTLVNYKKYIKVKIENILFFLYNSTNKLQLLLWLV